jgi:hypothetical protein
LWHGRNIQGARRNSTGLGREKLNKKKCRDSTVSCTTQRRRLKNKQNDREEI